MSLSPHLKLWLRCTKPHHCSWSAVAKSMTKALRGTTDLTSPIEKPGASLDVEMIVGDVLELHWNSESAFKIGYTVWEARSFPAEWLEFATRRVQMADLIIVPSEASATAFRELATDTPVEVVPLGYDPDEFYPVERRQGQFHKTRFLLAGVAQPRKGSWLVLEAFERAFRHSHKAELTVWSTDQQPMYFELQKEYAGNKRIRFDQERVESVREVFEQHDVLISAHLSEGYGLLIPEAMATGMPCIVSRCSAPMEFFDGRCGYWIEMTDDYVPIDLAFMADVPGFWRLPSVDSLAEQMREAVKHPKIAREKGDFAASYAAGKLTWGHSVAKLLDVLRGYVK